MTTNSKEGLLRPYAPRIVRSLGISAHADWTVKCYSISLSAEPVDEARFDAGKRLALATLPGPAVTSGRIGVAILILHQGRGVDYAVLGWWDRENELPLRVFVSESASAGWRPATGSESVCVWDLEVLWAERQSYVQTVLQSDSVSSVREYLEAVAGK